MGFVLRNQSKELQQEFDSDYWKEEPTVQNGGFES